MKWKIVLAIALALNLVLGFVAWSQLHQGWHPAPKVEIVQQEVPSAPRIQTRIINETNVVEEGFHWSQIESDDYALYVTNLRRIGCPADTIRDILEADVNATFDARAKALADGPSRQFWELLMEKDRFEKVIESKADELKELKEERDHLVKSLLGTDTPPAN